MITKRHLLPICILFLMLPLLAFQAAQATVSNTAIRQSFICIGTTTYSLNIYWVDNNDITVYRESSTGNITALKETAYYTLSGARTGSGTLKTVSAYSDGYLHVVREKEITPELGLQVSTRFSPYMLETAIFRRAKIDKYFEYGINWSLKTPIKFFDNFPPELDINRPDNVKSKFSAFDSVEEVDLIGFSVSRVNGGTYYVANYSLLKAIKEQADGVSVRVLGRVSKGDGGGGWFYWDSSDHSDAGTGYVSADPKHGTCVPPAWDKTGTSGAWFRVFDGPVSNLWFGTNQVALQAAIDFANNTYGLVIDGHRQYSLTSTLTIPTGWNHIEVIPAADGIDSDTLGAFVWTGGNDDIVVDIDQQDSGEYGLLKGMAVLNNDNATGITGYRFRDSAQSGASFRVNASHLTAAACEIGFRLGNEENGDSSASTNIDEGLFRRLKTYRCLTPLIFDTNNSDDNIFEDLFFEGSYGHIAEFSGTTTLRKIWVRKAGTNNTFKNIFVNASDIATDGQVVDIDDGDGAIYDINSESNDNPIRYFDIGGTVQRGGWVIQNFRCPFTGSGDMRDSSGNAATVSYWNGVTFIGGVLAGTLNATRPVTTVNVVYPSGYGPYENGTYGKVLELNSYTKSSSGAGVDNQYGTSKMRLDYLELRGTETDNRVLVTRPASSYYDLFNGISVDILKIEVPDDARIALRIPYFVWGPAVSNAHALVEVGEIIVSIVSDSGGNINTSIAKGMNDQVLNGFSRFNVAFTTTTDSVNDVVMISVSQTNDLSVSSIRGIFEAKSYFANPTLLSVDSLNFTWQ